jgi:hypothetical protein
VITIADDTGRQVRRFDVEKGPGLRRVAWNLRGDLPPAPAGGDGGGTGRGGGRGQAGGRGGPPQGPLVAPGTYRATLGRQVGDQVTAIGPSQTFRIVQVQQ